MSWVNLSGKLISEDTPVFGARERQFRFGGGFFESIKVSKKKVLHFHIHYERIMKSLLLLSMEKNHSWSEDYFIGLIAELFTKNDLTNASPTFLTMA